MSCNSTADSIIKDLKVLKKTRENRSVNSKKIKEMETKIEYLKGILKSLCEVEDANVSEDLQVEFNELLDLYEGLIWCDDAKNSNKNEYNKRNCKGLHIKSNIAEVSRKIGALAIKIGAALRKQSGGKRRGSRSTRRRRARRGTRKH